MAKVEKHPLFHLSFSVSETAMSKYQPEKAVKSFKINFRGADGSIVACHYRSFPDMAAAKVWAAAELERDRENLIEGFMQVTAKRERELDYLYSKMGFDPSKTYDGDEIKEMINKLLHLPMTKLKVFK